MGMGHGSQRFMLTAKIILKLFVNCYVLFSRWNAVAKPVTTHPQSARKTRLMALSFV